MTIKYFLSILCVLALATAVSTAQFGLGSYLPSQCQQKALEDLTGADDAIVVSIVNIGITVDLLGSDVDISMDMEKGTAVLWAYAVYSEKLDSLHLVPMLRLLTLCSVAPVDPGDNGGLLDDVALSPVPDDFNEGTKMVGHITSDVDYVEWVKAHPDSTPTIVVLASSEEEFFGFPKDSPFWVLQWQSQGADGSFICISHAESGETFCFQQPTTSVAAEASRAGFGLFPNPANNHAMLTVPHSWTGTRATVIVSDVTGREYTVAYNHLLTSPQIFIPLSDVPNGFWTVRVSNGHLMQTIPLSVVR